MNSEKNGTLMEIRSHIGSGTKERVKVALVAP